MPVRPDVHVPITGQPGTGDSARRREFELLQKDYRRLMESIPFVEEDLDYRMLERHIPWLEKMDRMSRTAISVFDMCRKTHVYVSPSYKERLGLPDSVRETDTGFDRYMIPEDLCLLMKAGIHFLKMMMRIPERNYRKFRLENDFPIHPPDGKPIRLTEHHSILETDPHGNIWLSLSVVSVSADQNILEPARSRLIDQEEGNVLVFPLSNGDPGLSAREREILSLISEGMVSKQIAGRLHVSVHTVNTHRQNILRKMNAANSAEAIRTATVLGLIQVSV